MANSRKSSTSAILEKCAITGITITESPASYLDAEDIVKAETLMSKIVFDDDDDLKKRYTIIHSATIAKLTKILSSQQIHFPLHRTQLNVISLGCGIPDDYFALKALLEQNNNSAVLSYVGIDINLKPSHEPNVDFSQFPEIKLITADATDPEKLKTVLSNANAVPANGFDIIFLRHPEILARNRHYPFQRMIRNVIPFLSGEKSTVFISAYLSLELILINGCLDSPGYAVLPDNELTTSGVILTKNVHGMQMEPENFSIVMHCSGPSLTLKSEVAEIKLEEEVFQTKRRKFTE
ncbi:MAG: hypothetical protein V4501_03040 [Pseudomonadota bacterium]